MLGEDFRLAALPLFAEGDVEVLEWSFDTCWGPEGIPDWAAELISTYAQAGSLYGHGVTFSPLSAGAHIRQQSWLERVTFECATNRYQHISEHFGFMTAGPFDRGTLLPMPLTDASLRIGRDRLARLKDAVGVGVGLENLALAFGLDDVARQGEFLEQLLEPVDGFLLLDLHNIYCQAINFDRDPARLLDDYPLDRVREIHLSGGSWSRTRAPGWRKQIRRDTHNHRVPDDVFELLSATLTRCPGVETVILERLDGTIVDRQEVAQFRTDFRKLRDIVGPVDDSRELIKYVSDQHTAHSMPSLTPPPGVVTTPVTDLLTSDDPTVPPLSVDPELATFQTALITALADEETPEAVVATLETQLGGQWSSYLDSFDHQLVEVAMVLVNKWGLRRES